MGRVDSHGGSLLMDESDCERIVRWPCSVPENHSALPTPAPPAPSLVLLIVLNKFNKTFQIMMNTKTLLENA